MEQPLKRLTVVHISSGQKREAAIADYGESLYWIENLRKDGRNNQARGRDGWLVNGKYVDLYKYALYDAGREAKAALIRDQIAILTDQIHVLQQALIALYISPQAQ